MGTLLYLEGRYAFHQAAAILRSPLRLVLWVPYALSVGYLAYLRLGAQHHAVLSVSVMQPRFASVLAGLYLGTLGATAGLAAAGRVAAFRSSAEAVLFSNGGVPPLSVALWLQLRKLAMGSFRWFASLAYLFVLAAPAHGGAGAAARALLGAVLAVGLMMTCELPAFLLARRTGYLIPILTWTIAAFGFGFALASALGRRFLNPLIATLHVDPGGFASALLAGRPTPMLTLAAVLAVLLASMLLLGSDAIPELYAVTQQTLAIRSRRRRFANETTFLADGGRRQARIPAGAAALVWKDWVAFRRGRGTVRLWLIGAMFWAACGAGVAYASMRWEDPSPLFSLVGMSATLLVISAPLGATVGLAADLAKPIFWLSRSPLRARLAAWTFARSWRGGTAIALAPLVAGLVGGNPLLTLGALPLSIVSYWSLQALGVGLYAIFPNPIDGRGPMMLLRLALTGIYILPAVAAALLVSAFDLSPLIAVFAFVVTLGLEGWLIIEATTYRFREYGASLATLSRAT